MFKYFSFSQDSSCRQNLINKRKKIIQLSCISLFKTGTSPSIIFQMQIPITNTQPCGWILHNLQCKLTYMYISLVIFVNKKTHSNRCSFFIFNILKGSFNFFFTIFSALFCRHVWHFLKKVRRTSSNVRIWPLKHIYYIQIPNVVI